MQTQYFDSSNGFSAHSESTSATATVAWSPTAVHDESVSVSISGGEIRTTVSSAEATTISTLPADVLTINGVTATRQAFINAGILSDDSQSSNLPQAAQESAQNAVEEDQPQTTPHALTEDAVEALNYTMENIPDSSLVNVTTLGINAALADGDITALVSEVTAITGEAPFYAQERFEQAQAIFQSQADKALSAVGVDDLEAFYGFARTHHKAALNAAVQRQVFASDLDGYVPIVKAWKFQQTLSR